MDKPRINQKDMFNIQRIDMGKKIKPIFTECPNCKTEITYLGETKCQHCGTLISFEEGTQIDITGDIVNAD